MVAPAPPQDRDARASDELRPAAKHAPDGDSLREAGEPVPSQFYRKCCKHRHAREHHHNARHPSPSRRRREQREQQVRRELGRDRPGGCVPRGRCRGPYLEQEQVRRQCAPPEPRRVAAPGRLQRNREHDRDAKHGEMQRPDPRDPAPPEAGHSAPARRRHPLRMDQPDHETGQQEEEVHRQITARHHRLGPSWRGDVEAEVIQHDPPRRDPARSRQGAKLNQAGASRARRIGRKLSPARARAQ